MNNSASSEQSNSSKEWAWSPVRRQLYSIIGITLLSLGFFIPWANLNLPRGGRFSVLLGTFAGPAADSISVSGCPLLAGSISMYRGLLILWLGIAAGLMALMGSEQVARFLRPFRLTALLIGITLLFHVLSLISDEHGTIQHGFVIAAAAYGLLGFGLLLDIFRKGN